MSRMLLREVPLLMLEALSTRRKLPRLSAFVIGWEGRYQHSSLSLLLTCSMNPLRKSVVVVSSYLL